MKRAFIILIVMITMYFGSACSEEAQQPQTVILLTDQGLEKKSKANARLLSVSEEILLLLPVFEINPVVYYNSDCLLAYTFATHTVQERYEELDILKNEIKRSQRNEIKYQSVLTLCQSVVDEALSMGTIPEVHWVIRTDITAKETDPLSILLNKILASAVRLHIYIVSDTGLPGLEQVLAGYPSIAIRKQNEDELMSSLVEPMLLKRKYQPVGRYSTPINRSFARLPDMTLPLEASVIITQYTVSLAENETPQVHVAFLKENEVLELIDGLPASLLYPSPEPALIDEDQGNEAAMDSNEQDRDGNSLTEQTPLRIVGRMRWYGKPATDIGWTLDQTEYSIPYAYAQENATIVMEFVPTLQEAQALKWLGTGGFTAVIDKIQPFAFILNEIGIERELEISGMTDHPLSFQVIIPRLPQGRYTLRIEFQIQEGSFNTTYPYSADVIFNSPVPAKIKKSYERTLTLVIDPKPWENQANKQEALIYGAELFDGDYEPLKLTQNVEGIVEVIPKTDQWIIQPVKPGHVTLVVTSERDATADPMLIEVYVVSGMQELFLWGAIILGGGIMLFLLLLFIKRHQPRFRKGEIIRLWLYDKLNECKGERELSLERYYGKGVSLWRLIVLSGDAGEWHDSRAILVKIGFLPKHDGLELCVKDKSVSVNESIGMNTYRLCNGEEIIILFGSRRIRVRVNQVKK